MILKVLAASLAIGCSVLSAAPGDRLFSVMPTIPVSNQDFGDAVAISGNLVLVGAEDTPEGSVLSAGAAFLFDGVTGAQLRKLTPNESPATRAFGTSVAIDNQQLVIGAEDENLSKGAAYFFNVNGTQLHKVVANDGVAGDEFGQDVAIGGNVAAVSAPGAGALGGLYLFNVTTGVQIGSTIRPADLSPNAEFGSSIDMDREHVIVSIDNFGLGGAAYIYDTAGLLVNKLTLPSQFSSVRGFGRYVAIDGDYALVGATPSSDQTLGDRGTAFLFNVTTGAFLRQFTPLDSQADDLFGEGVALSGSLALVAARREDALGIANTAYLFDVNTGVQLARMDGAGIPAGDESFEAIDIDGAWIVAGQEGFDSPGFANNGRANVFSALVADYNNNGTIDAADYTVWRDTLGQTGAGLAADGNVNNVIDSGDYSLWRGNFGKSLSGPGAAASTAEPATLTVLAIVATLGWLRRLPRCGSRPGAMLIVVCSR
jgi:hypothetical protein